MIRRATQPEKKITKHNRTFAHAGDFVREGGEGIAHRVEVAF